MHSGAETPGSKLRVAVVGGGLCGLTLGVVLSRSGQVDVQLFESASRFGEVGAGVVIGSNAVVALQRLGLLDNVCTHTRQKPHTSNISYAMDHGEKGSVKPISSVPYSHPPGDLAISRTAFLDSLVPLFPHRLAHFKKRCLDVTYSPSDNIYRVHFTDGTFYDADLVIGADGIRSTVRRVMFQPGELRPTEPRKTEYSPPLGSLAEDKHLSFSGTTLYRAVVPSLLLRRKGVKMDFQKMLITLGPTSNHIFSVPICNGTMINMVAYSHDLSKPGHRRPPLAYPWTRRDISLDEVSDNFEGWGDDVQNMLGSMGEYTSAWDLHLLDPGLDTYSRGNMVLVGDAAHAMTPHMGAGVGQGIEDVFLLARLLIDPRTNCKNISTVMQVYDQVRRPRANWVLEQSTQMGRLYGSVGPDSPPGELEAMLKGYEETFARVQEYDVEKDAEAATMLLERQGVYA